MRTYEPLSIGKLRKRAKICFCAKCYAQYEKVFEPMVRSLWLQFFDDWRWIEYEIYFMALYQNNVWNLEVKRGYFEDGERYGTTYEHTVGNQTLFKKIERWSFKRKIDDLFEKRILPKYVHKLLNQARIIRNKVHQNPIIVHFSENELELFTEIREVILPLFGAFTSPITSEKSKQEAKSQSSKSADRILSKLKKEESSKHIDYWYEPSGTDGQTYTIQIPEEEKR